MNVLSLLIVAGWILTQAPLAVADVSKDEAQGVFATVEASVVSVFNVDEQGNDEMQGSGVVIGPGLIATNCHVIRNASSIRIVGKRGSFPGKWIRQDAQRDLCVLSVAGFGAPVVGLRSSTSLSVGEPVFAVGNPLGFGLAVSAGLISVINTKDGQATVIASAPQSPGSSGGGLFDREGRLVGITTAVLGTGQNLNLALSSDGLDRLAAGGNGAPNVSLPPPPERHWEKEAIALQQASEWTKLEVLAGDWKRAKPTAAAAPAFIGLAQYRMLHFQEAITTLRAAIELDKHYAFAWLIYGEALEGAGRSVEADQALKEAELAQPSYPLPPEMRAEWLRKKGRLDEALLQIKESIRRGAGRGSAWRTLGVIADARGDRTEALRAFQTALRLGEADVDTRQRVTQLLASSGKTDEASRATAQSTLGKNESARTQLAIGVSEMARGRLGPAEDALRKAIVQAPELVDAWFSLAAVLVKSNRAAEAEKAYDQALLLSPDNAEVLANRALIRLTNKGLEAALADARRAIAIDPKLAQAWRVYGMIQTEARVFPEVVVAFKKIDALGQSTIDDLVSLGEYQAAIGDVDAGLKTLARAEAMDATHGRMCLSTAKVLGNKGDIGTALGYLERAIKIDPANANAWSSKGYGLMKLGRLKEAVDALETAVALAPDLSNSWINLGEAQLRSRNLGRAIQALEKATALAPQAMDARLFLGQAYLGARQAGKSREQAEWLLQRQPALVPGLGLLCMSYLLEGNLPGASTPYLRLKGVAPAVARSLRSQAIASGMMVAGQLPE